MDKNEFLINIENLTKRYGNYTALNDINIQIPCGKIIGLLGPNGSGKTTLIKLIVNLLTKYDGKILIDGQEPSSYTKSIISYLPDRNYLSNKWTAVDAISYFSDFYDDFDSKMAYNLLFELHINLNMRFNAMSKGTKEKLQLILVLSRKAKLYVFDEPIAGVDPATRDLIFRLITQNYNKEASIIISTHLVHDIESILDQVIFLKQGRIIMYGDVEKIIKANQKSLEDIFKEIFKC